MIGPTGVGKTEIARRLSRLANAPFLKIEASKFTEVGYVGRDVESMIRDLAEISVSMVKQEYLEKIREKAKHLAEERLLDLLLPQPRTFKDRGGRTGKGEEQGDKGETEGTAEERQARFPLCRYRGEGKSHAFWRYLERRS